MNGPANEEFQLPEPSTEEEAVATVTMGLVWLYNHYQAHNRDARRRVARAAVKTAETLMVKIGEAGVEDVEP